MTEIITSALDPRWITAAGAAVGGVIALRIVIHWCRMRWVFRGSGGTIIALLGESACAVMRPHGSGTVGPISYETETAYFALGADKYMLCARALERLRNEGYVLFAGKRYRLSHLGRLVLDNYDNNRLLARSVARARQHDHPRCVGGRYLHCRCTRYWRLVAGRKIPLPFFLGSKLQRTHECRILQSRLSDSSSPKERP